MMNNRARHSSNYLLVHWISRGKSSLVRATIDLSYEQMNFKANFSVSKYISAILNNFCKTNTCNPYALV